MKKFYSHIIEIESLFVELDDLELDLVQRHELAELIDAHLHASIMDAILSELSDEDKKLFLNRVNSGDHEKVWEHLNSKTKNIEQKIVEAAESLKKELHEDIKEAKRRSGH